MPNTLEISLNEEIDEFTTKLQQLDKEQARNSDFSPEIQSELDSAISKILNRCKRFEQNYNGSEEELKDIKQKFREDISPWYEETFLLQRALNKPRGYPGDYITLEGVYNNEPLSKGLGAYLERFFLNSDLAEAIRNRKDFVRDWISQKITDSQQGIRTLNLASGSCREWYELCHQDLANIELTCLDFDEEALNFSTARLKESSNLTVYTIRDNMLKFSLRTKSQDEQVQNQDLVYSIGLYDYLPDKALGKVIDKQYSLLNAGGELLIAFKDSRNYDPIMYDWWMDWHFVPRTKPQVDKFLINLGYDSNKMESSWEKSGIIFFYEIKK